MQRDGEVRRHVDDAGILRSCLPCPGRNTGRHQTNNTPKHNNTKNLKAKPQTTNRKNRPRPYKEQQKKTHVHIRKKGTRKVELHIYENGISGKGPETTFVWGSPIGCQIKPRGEKNTTKETTCLPDVFSSVSHPAQVLDKMFSKYGLVKSHRLINKIARF